MVSASLAKILLMVACVLGILQGAMFLVGGILATKDNNKDLDNYVDTNPYRLIGTRTGDNKYYCGAIRLRPTATNINVKDASCDPKFDKMDRGWFKRVYDMCSKNDIGKLYGGQVPDATRTDITNSEICKLRGYKYVFALSIACGCAWVVAGIIALLASIMENKLVGFAAGGLFAAAYIVFVVLFSLIWHSVRNFNKSCLNNSCKDIRKRGKKSSYEVLAYSICAFVLIFVSIICCFLGALDVEEEPGKGKGSAYPDYTGENEKDRLTDSKYGKEEEEPMLAKDKHPPPKKPDAISPAAKDYENLFQLFNKYITDEDKMKKYSDKKFDQTDTDKSNTITLNEFRDFVNGLMKKKNLPPPPERKVTALMKKYDTDKNGTLERNEFHQMLLEIFIESRELLIEQYAAKKADSWKPGKVPRRKDTSKVADLDKLLKNSEDLNTVLEQIAKQEGKSLNGTLDIDEVTDLLRIFCERYKVPSLNRDEITEVMFDMDRDIVDYDKIDLNMAAYAVLSISRNLLK
jgi:hypothetical protein